MIDKVDAFRERFHPLADSYLFELVVDSYAAWMERSYNSCCGEWEQEQAGLVEEQLLKLARVRGIDIVGGHCGWCEHRKDDVRHDGDQCADCRREDLEGERRRLEREEDHLRRLAAMTPQERTRFEASAKAEMQIYTGGLMSRDVQ